MSRPTAVLEGAEWRKLLNSIPAGTLRDLRDRTLIADHSAMPGMKTDHGATSVTRHAVVQ
jgi:hypothetical protein